MLYRTLRKLTITNMRESMYVVTPRCAAAAAVVSAVVLRRATIEYTHPYSTTHRRMPTAGIEVAPHYHHLLVCISTPRNRRRKRINKITEKEREIQDKRKEVK